MVNVNPKIVLDLGIIKGDISPTQIQQVGIDMTVLDQVTIKPQSFANIAFREDVDMQNSFGLLVIRSSLSRLGMFLSSGVYDPGFKGVPGCTLYNLGHLPFIIKPGDRICQMVVFLADASHQYKGHYNISNDIKSKLGSNRATDKTTDRSQPHSERG